MKEFVFTSLSAEFRRNFIIATVLMLVLGIAVMASTIVKLHNQIETLNNQRVDCERRTTEIVNTLRQEQIKMIQELAEKQQAIEAEIKQISKRKKSKK